MRKFHDPGAFILPCQTGQNFSGGYHADSKGQILFDTLDNMNY